MKRSFSPPSSEGSEDSEAGTTTTSADQSKKPKKENEEEHILSESDALSLAFDVVAKSLFLEDNRILRFHWITMLTVLSGDDYGPFHKFRYQLIGKFIYYLALTGLTKETRYEMFFAELRKNIEVGYSYERSENDEDDGEAHYLRKDPVTAFFDLLGLLYVCVAKILQKFNRSVNLAENPLKFCSELTEYTGQNKRLLFDNILHCYLTLCRRGLVLMREFLDGQRRDAHRYAKELGEGLSRRCWPTRNRDGTMKKEDALFVSEELVRMTKVCLSHDDLAAQFYKVGYIEELCQFEKFVGKKLSAPTVFIFTKSEEGK